MWQGSTAVVSDISSATEGYARGKTTLSDLRAPFIHEPLWRRRQLERCSRRQSAADHTSQPHLVTRNKEYENCSSWDFLKLQARGAQTAHNSVFLQKCCIPWKRAK